MSIIITAEKVIKACPTAKKLDLLVPELNSLCQQYNINTVNRVSMFLAQCLHESGGFRWLQEIWGPTQWQIKYEGHIKLGNTQPGDGKLFMGRGLIQLTGRSNYQKFANWIQDSQIMITPAIVAEPKYAVLSAIYYWVVNDLNRFADTDDIKGCTKAVNGARMLGLEERTKYYNSLKTNL